MSSTISNHFDNLLTDVSSSSTLTQPKSLWNHAVLAGGLEAFLPPSPTLQTSPQLLHYVAKVWKSTDFNVDTEFFEEEQEENLEEDLQQFLEERPDSSSPHQARKWLAGQSQELAEEGNIIILELPKKPTLNHENDAAFFQCYLERLFKKDPRQACVIIWQGQLDLLAGELRAQGKGGLSPFEEGFVVDGRLIPRSSAYAILFDPTLLQRLLEMKLPKVMSTWLQALITSPPGKEREVYEGFSAAFSLEMIRRRLAGAAALSLPSFEECFLGVDLPLSKKEHLFFVPIPSLVTGVLYPRGNTKIRWAIQFIGAFEESFPLPARPVPPRVIASLQDECYEMLISSNLKKDPQQARQSLKEQLLNLVDLVQAEYRYACIALRQLFVGTSQPVFVSMVPAFYLVPQVQYLAQPILQNVHQKRSSSSIRISQAQHTKSIAEVIQNKQKEAPVVWIAWLLEWQLYVLDKTCPETFLWEQQIVQKEALKKELLNPQLCQSACVRSGNDYAMNQVIHTWFTALTHSSFEEAEEVFYALGTSLWLNIFTKPVEEMLAFFAKSDRLVLSVSLDGPNIEVPYASVLPASILNESGWRRCLQFLEARMEAYPEMHTMSQEQADQIVTYLQSMGLNEHAICDYLIRELGREQEAFLRYTIQWLQATAYGSKGLELFACLLEAWSRIKSSVTHHLPGVQMIELMSLCMRAASPEDGALEHCSHLLLEQAERFSFCSEEEAKLWESIFAMLPRLFLERWHQEFYACLLRVWIEDGQLQEMACRCLVAWHQQGVMVALPGKVRDWIYEQGQQWCLDENPLALPLLCALTRIKSLPSVEPLQASKWQEAFPGPSEEVAWLLVAYAGTLEGALRLVPLQFLLGRLKWKLEEGKLARAFCYVTVQLLQHISAPQRKAWKGVLQGAWVPQEYRQVFDQWAQEQTFPSQHLVKTTSRSEGEEQIELLKAALEHGHLQEAVIAWKNCHILLKKARNHEEVRRLTGLLGEQLLEQQQWQQFIDLVGFTKKRPSLVRQQEFVHKMLEKLITMRSAHILDAWYWALARALLPKDNFSLGCKIAHTLILEKTRQTASRAKKLWEEIAQKKISLDGDAIAFLTDAVLIDADHRAYWLAAMRRSSTDRQALPVVHDALVKMSSDHLHDALSWLNHLAQEKAWQQVLPPSASLLLIEAMIQGQWQQVLSHVQIWWKYIDASSQQQIQDAFSSVFKNALDLNAPTFFGLAKIFAADSDQALFTAWIGMLPRWIDQHPAEVLCFLKSYESKFIGEEAKETFDRILLQAFKKMTDKNPSLQELNACFQQNLIPYHEEAREDLYFLQTQIAKKYIEKNFRHKHLVTNSMTSQMMTSMDALWHAIPDELKNFPLKYTYVDIKLIFSADLYGLVKATEELAVFFQKAKNIEEQGVFHALWIVISKVLIEYKDDNIQYLFSRVEQIFNPDSKAPPPWFLGFFQKGCVLWNVWKPWILASWPVDQESIAIYLAAFLHVGVKSETKIALSWAYEIRALQLKVGLDQLTHIDDPCYNGYLILLKHIFKWELKEGNIDRVVCIMEELIEICKHDPVTRRVVSILNEVLIMCAEWVCQSTDAMKKEDAKHSFLTIAEKSLIPLLVRRYCEKDVTQHVDISITCAVEIDETAHDIRHIAKVSWFNLFSNYPQEAPFVLSLLLSNLSSLVRVPEVPIKDIIEEIGLVHCLYWNLPKHPGSFNIFYHQEERLTAIYQKIDLIENKSDYECGVILAWQLLHFYLSKKADPFTLLLVAEPLQTKWIPSVGYLIKTLFSLALGRKSYVIAAYDFLETCSQNLQACLYQFPEYRELYDSWRRNIYGDLAQQKMIYLYNLVTQFAMVQKYEELKAVVQREWDRLDEHFLKMGEFGSLKDYDASYLSCDVQKEDQASQATPFSSEEEVVVFLIGLDSRLQVISRSIQMLDGDQLRGSILSSLLINMRRLTILLEELLSESGPHFKVSHNEISVYTKNTSKLLTTIEELLTFHEKPLLAFESSNIGYVSQLICYAPTLLGTLKNISASVSSYKVARDHIVSISKVLTRYYEKARARYMFNESI